MVDDDDRQTTDPGHPISSPCEPNSSGELKKTERFTKRGMLLLGLVILLGTFSLKF